MLMKLTKKEIIEMNKGIIEEWLYEHPKEFEGVGVDEQELGKVLNIVEKQETPIMQATYMMAQIAWVQPFSSGNKRTAFTCADTLLRMEGYRLEIKSQNDLALLINLLQEIQAERSRLSPETLAKIVLYVVRRIRKQ